MQAFVDVVDEVLPRSSIQEKWLTDLTSCQVDVGQPRTVDEEEVSEYPLQNMWSLRFASEPISDPTLF